MLLGLGMLNEKKVFIPISKLIVGNIENQSLVYY